MTYLDFFATPPRNKFGLKGVSFVQGTKKPWLASLFFRGERVVVGRFATKKEAADAYDAWVRRHIGPVAYVNDYPKDEQDEEWFNSNYDPREGLPITLVPRPK